MPPPRERYATRGVGRAAARLRALTRSPRRIKSGEWTIAHGRARAWATGTRTAAHAGQRTRTRLALDLADLVVGLGPRWSAEDWVRFLRGEDSDSSRRFFERWKALLVQHAPAVLEVLGRGRYALDVAGALAWSDLVLGLDAEPGEEEVPSVFGAGPWGRPAHSVPAARRHAEEQQQGNEEAPRAAGRRGAA